MVSVSILGGDFHILTQPLTHTTVMVLTMITRKRQAPQASPSEGSTLGCLSLRGKSLPPLSGTAGLQLDHQSRTAGSKVWPDHTLEAELTASSSPCPPPTTKARLPYE